MMSPHTQLAKLAVETYIKSGKKIKAPSDLLAGLADKKAGVFITIENNGVLRGCIGTYLPAKENLAEEIIDNAIAAATRDYRFEPIQDYEFPSLSYTVSVLSEPELIEDKQYLDPKKYGVIVKTRTPMKSGILLPDLENVNSIDEQITIACQKAGINPEKENFLIYRFTAEQYNE